MGLITTDLKYDAVRTEFQAGEAVDLARLNNDFGAMQDELAQQLAADVAESNDREVIGRNGFPLSGSV